MFLMDPLVFYGLPPFYFLFMDSLLTDSLIVHY
jgi:hypothetical protein